MHLALAVSKTVVHRHQYCWQQIMLTPHTIRISSIQSRIPSLLLRPGSTLSAYLGQSRVELPLEGVPLVADFMQLALGQA